MNNIRVYLHVAQLSTNVKKILYSTLAVIAASAAAYLPLLLRLGYSYELHVAYTIVFTSLSILITLVLFGGAREGFDGQVKIKVVLSSLVILVLAEELLLNSTFANYGLALAILGLVFLPILAILLGRGNGWLRVALEAVALIFATRVVLAPFQLGFLGLPMFLPTIYTLILAALVLYLIYRGIPTGDLRISFGKRGLGFQLFSGLCVGAIIGLVEYFVLRPQPILAGAGFVQMLAYTLIVLMLMVGVVEEILFRGLLQCSLERVMPVWQAIGITSVVFGLMHVGWMNPLEVLLAYGAGVAFGYMAVVTDSLFAPIMAHGFGNVVLYMIAFLS